MLLYVTLYVSLAFMMKTILNFISALILFPFRPNIKQVLNLVNVARDAQNLPAIETLPQGSKGRSTSCPLAQALGGIVGVDGICFQDHYRAQFVASAWQTRVYNRGHQRYVVDLPETLKHFVRDFDLGAYRLSR